jgi:hypothetical protein
VPAKAGTPTFYGNGEIWLGRDHPLLNVINIHVEKLADVDYLSE